MQNDLISRSALLENLNRFAPEHYNALVNMLIEKQPAVDAVKVGSCDGCYWKEIGRQQKCSCCRRNRYMKDCYERGAKDGV